MVPWKTADCLWRCRAELMAPTRKHDSHRIQGIEGILTTWLQLLNGPRLVQKLGNHFCDRTGMVNVTEYGQDRSGA